MTSAFGAMFAPRPERAAMPEDAHREMRRRTLELAADMNQASDGSVRLDAEYLLVVARKPG